MEEVLGEEPEVKEQLFEVLKQYAAERDVEALADALPDILTSEEHQQLIDSVRYRRPSSQLGGGGGGGGVGLPCM